MRKLKDIIKKYWIFFIIITQPILDIIAYFTFEKNITIITFTIRSIYLLFIIIYSFITTKEKKKMVISMLPFAIFSILHILNSYRISGNILFCDIRYLIMVLQMPIIVISLIYYSKNNKLDSIQIEKGFAYCLGIIFISVLISMLTNTYQYTYEGYGITGWFTSANTQSMILSALSPLALYYFSKRNNFVYSLGLIMIFTLLFFNGTKACYYTLILLLVVIIYVLFVNKENSVKKMLTILFLFVSILSYNLSFTHNRSEQVNKTNKNNEQLIENHKYEEKDIIDMIRKNELYERIIEEYDENKIYLEVKDTFDSNMLSDNRLAKRTYAKIKFENSDILTKFLGINYYEIEKNEMDLENDLTAIFYYYGYLGFGIYILFILYFAYLSIKLIIKAPIVLLSGKFIILGFSILLELFGSEYSGALLRKTNANIYFALLLVVLYIYIKDKYNKLDKKLVDNKKISFFLLHLGYGGIESSTINTANALSDKYDVELICFYKLNNDQNNKLNNKIKVIYLYNGGPNKDEFTSCLKKHAYIRMFVEGLKAIDILIKKKTLIIKQILKCKSKYIVSTRYDFSVLLSRYGSKTQVKIAQEHHYHNNNNKYINVIKNKYNNIDYLFALTKTLEKDYKNFLVKNNHTKVVLVPNMLYDIPDKVSNLNNKNIITISRLDYEKRNDDIITAFSKLKEKDWKLYIIRDGKEFDNLTKLIKELKLKNRVILTGYKNKEEVEEYMLNSSLFLMASETEGLPMVLLEAMSYGVPCIAYETDSGVNDIIDNNKNGYVIKNRNKEEFIEKIEMLIINENLRNKLGKNARNKVKNFSKEKILNIWKKILK